jgi:hypothetical protein
MNINDNNRNGSRGLPVQLEEFPESRVSQAPPATETTGSEVKEEPAIAPSAGFATRASVQGTDGMSKSKLLLLGGGLAIAVLFFVFTAVIGRSPKKQVKPTQQAKQAEPKLAKGSVTPVMDTVRPPAPDNANGQLGPGDIWRTRSSDGGASSSPNSQLAQKQPIAKPAAAGALGSVPSFADTQQKWEEPQPYGEPSPVPASQTQQQQNALKEPSLVFVRSQVQNQSAAAGRATSGGDGAPLLEMTPGTRIQAKLETQISSAVLARPGG